MVAWVDTRAGRRRTAAVGATIAVLGGITWLVGGRAWSPLKVVGMVVALFGAWKLVWAYTHETRSGLPPWPSPSESCRANAHDQCVGPPSTRSCGCQCHFSVPVPQGPARDAYLMWRAGGAQPLCDAGVAVRAYVSGTEDREVPRGSWPDAFRALQPESVTVDANGAYLTVTTNRLFAAGLYVTFEDSVPQGAGQRHTFTLVAPRIYGYQRIGRPDA
jgi:hypothetical protein